MELKTVYIDPTTGAETVLTGFDYTLNQSGHRLAVTEADGRQVSYTYDELYRLTEESINNGKRVLAYTYDSVGNRLTKDDSLVGLTTYTYDANDRLLSEVLTQAGVAIHTITYTYDDNGNLLSRTQVTDAASETTTYTWNDDDRLVAVATPDGSSVTYEYDEEGIRVSSTVDGVTTDYLIDKNRPYAQVLEELSSEQIQAFYVYGHDLISQTRNTEQDFYQVDGLGSTRALTDENGNVTDTYDYEAFGELIESSGESENSYQFAGEQFDEALGDYYLRQRFYDPSSGRFTRRDTYEGKISQPLTIQKYLYTQNNPINYVDPSGLFTVSEISIANKLRNELAAIQIDNGRELINAVGGEDNPLVQFLNHVAAAVEFYQTAFLLIGAVRIGSVNLPEGTNRPSYKYQKLVTGKDYEESWKLDTGRKISVDGHPDNYLIEAKWTGQNESAWRKSPLNPTSRYYDENKFLDQAERYIQLNKELDGGGVRYTFSTLEAVDHYEQVLKRKFPKEFSNGTLKVYHVPGNGM